MGIEPINRNQIFDLNPSRLFEMKGGGRAGIGTPATSDEVESAGMRHHPRFKTFIDEAVERLREAGDLFNRRLDFRVDEETNRIVVKVIDTRTDKVIKEIPPEQLVQLAAKIQKMIGLLVDEER